MINDLKQKSVKGWGDSSLSTMMVSITELIHRFSTKSCDRKKLVVMIELYNTS